VSETSKMSMSMAATALPHKNPYREEGNRLYKRAHAEGNSPYIRKVLLTKAIANYEKAAPFASGDEDEKASVEKNMGLAHYALSSLGHLPPSELADHKRDALKFLLSALKRVQSGAAKRHGADWRKTVEEHVEKVFLSGMEKVEELARESDDRKKENEDESDDDSDDDDSDAVDSDEANNNPGKKYFKSKSMAKKNAKQKAKKEREELITAREWVRFFYVMIEPVEPRTRLVDPYVSFAKMLFRYAVRSREKGDFKDALYCLDEMAYPLGEAERLSSEKKKEKVEPEAEENHLALLDEVRVAREEVTMEKSIADAMRAIEQGGELLTIAVFSDETTNMDLVFEALDWFKNASIMARGFDLEQEAIACHHIGRIFEKIIKLKGRAKEYYMQVMNLTEACKPRTFYGKSWYYDTTTSLKEFQEEAAKRDDVEKQKKRQAHLDLLKDELKLLKDADDKVYAVYELVDLIIDKFPPKVKAKKFKDFDKTDLDHCREMEEWNFMTSKDKEGKEDPWTKYNKDRSSHMSTKKKLLLKFLSDYHPDRNSAKEYGEKWSVLSEEITKHVTRHYESMKG